MTAEEEPTTYPDIEVSASLLLPHSDASVVEVWTEGAGGTYLSMTPAEARRVAAELMVAADEAEVMNAQGPDGEYVTEVLLDLAIRAEADLEADLVRFGPVGHGYRRDELLAQARERTRALREKLDALRAEQPEA